MNQRKNRRQSERTKSVKITENEITRNETREEEKRGTTCSLMPRSLQALNPDNPPGESKGITMCCNNNKFHNAQTDRMRRETQIAHDWPHSQTRNPRHIVNALVEMKEMTKCFKIKKNPNTELRD